MLSVYTDEKIKNNVISKIDLYTKSISVFGKDVCLHVLKSSKFAVDNNGTMVDIDVLIKKYNLNDRMQAFE